MTREEAIKMLTAKAECMTRDTSGMDEDCNSHNCGECNLCYEQGNMGEQVEYLQMAIKALEEPHWIPCSERLPEDRSKTWVTTEWGDDDRTAEYAFYWDNELKWGAITENVVAWMPLPEPYKKNA